jgi:hypothetical protein
MLEPAGHLLKPAGHMLEPASRVFKPAGRVFKPNCIMLGFQPANLYVVCHLAQGVAVGLEYIGLSARILYAMWRNCATW